MEDKRRWEEALPRFSLSRKVAVLVLMLSGLVVGTVATLKIPVELIPRGYQAPQLSLSLQWRDSPPAEVLDKVVAPLEEELSTVRGLKQLNSQSTTGSGSLFLSFAQGTDMDVAYREVRDRILHARPRLPSDLSPIQIKKQSSSSIPIMAIGVALNSQLTDAQALLQEEIVRPLQRVDGVASVASPSLEQKEIVIELNRERTEAAGLNIFLIAKQLRASNFTMASGSVRHDGHLLMVRSVSRLADIEAIREQPVTDNLRLRDIATITLQAPKKRWFVRVNGKPALSLQVFKEGQANTIEVCDRLERVFEEIQNNPKLHGTDIGMLFSQGDVIDESISTLVGSGKTGVLLAALALLFFVRRFRLTIIITLSIPLSLLLSLTVMFFAGETLNILSLLGLIISVGLLVDNSIVVAENILRIRRLGAAPRKACIQGTAEIALAIVLATLTTIVVFLPVALVAGKAQFFLLRLAIPITVSLAASLLVALIFVPLFVYLTLRSTDSNCSQVQVRQPSPSVTDRLHKVMDATLGWAYEHSFARLSGLYGRILSVALKRRLELIVLLLVIFLGTLLGPGKKIHVVEVSQENQNGFSIEVSLPISFGLSETTKLFDEIERVLKKAKPHLQLEGYFTFHQAAHGQVKGWFGESPKYTRTQAVEYLLDRLPMRPDTYYFSGSQDLGLTPRTRQTMSVTFTGENSAVLASFSETLEKIFRRVPGVVGVRNASVMPPRELGLQIDREQSERLGVNPQYIAGVVSTALRGQSLPRLQQGGREIPVRLRFRERDTDSLGELGDFSVPTRSGEIQKLSALTDFRFLSSPTDIYRQDKRITRNVTMDLRDEHIEETRAAIGALLDNIKLPEGVHWWSEEGTNHQNDDSDVASLKFAAWISILFVYLLMAFLFESFILPLSIIFTIPAASIGVIGAHTLAGRELDFLGLVGVILLIGVVVNNGIVFVDYVNRLVQAGEARSQAILLAAKHRFRPIMMTATTTIGGMIPLTLGEPSSIGLSYRSFGLTLMGGMATATILTLLVVPILYTLLDDASHRVHALLRRAL